MSRYFLLIVGFAVAFGACVPLKQFEKVQDENDRLEQEAGDITEQNEALKVENKELTADYERLKNKVEKLAQNTARLGRHHRRLQHRYDDLNKNYSDVIGGLKTTSVSDADNRKLLEFLQQLQEDLIKREDELRASERALDEKRMSLNKAEEQLGNAQLQLDDQNKRLLELEALLNSKEEAMQALKRMITDALKGYTGDELQVHSKNGKVYVSMEEKLLFQSGSYDLNQQGVAALKKIARVLEQNEEIDILVEGHTDRVPYRGSGALKDNWDLSVKRATSVVRILLNNSSIDAHRVMAAGRSEYDPLKPGDDAASLQKNRRTEIILTPKWSEVFDLLDVDN